MKFIIAILLYSFIAVDVFSDNIAESINKVIINPHLSSDINIPTEAKSYLKDKLNEMITKNGISSIQINPRFILTVSIFNETKDIIPGPPQMMAQSLRMTLFIGDAVNSTLFSSHAISLKGVGTTETKAYIDAIKKIDPSNIDLNSFIENGKKKIVDYYNSKCESILIEARTLSQKGSFQEAIDELSIVPDACKECFEKSTFLSIEIFKNKMENDCFTSLNKAKTIWDSEPNQNGATKAAQILNSVLPVNNCKKELENLFSNIKSTLNVEQQRKYDLEITKQRRIAENEERLHELKKLYIVEYYRNRPKVIIYNNIFWR
jgi:hypothetical protein